MVKVFKELNAKMETLHRELHLQMGDQWILEEVNRLYIKNSMAWFHMRFLHAEGELVKQNLDRK